jgi:Ca-activated chloride channel family protein
MRTNRYNKFKRPFERAFLFFLAALAPVMSYAQEEKKFIFEGNKNYKEKKFDEAEKNYKLGLNKNKKSYKGIFNLGDAYYKQGKYEEAAEQFQALTHTISSKDTLAKAYHNLGNCFLKSKKYKESIDAYKNALKNNPNDDDTRYNLACAQQYLKQQQQQQEKDKKDEKKEDKEDKKNEKKDEKDKNDQEKKDKEEKEKQDQKKPEEQKSKISKEDAQRLLDALQNDERNLQNKVKKGQPGMKIQIEKDW